MSHGYLFVLNLSYIIRITSKDEQEYFKPASILCPNLAL